MKLKLKRYFKEFIYFIIIITLLTNAISLYKSQSLNSEPLNLKRVNLLDNVTYNLPDKKPLLIHFWATWCPTCKLEASNIEFISHRFEVITIAVNSRRDDEIKQFLKERDYSYKVVNDHNGEFASKFKVSAFPTTFIYDQNKKLLFSEVGYSSTFSLYLKMLWAKYR